MAKNIKWFNEIEIDDIAVVGGKNGSLGTMIRNLSSLGINIPNGFAVTTHAYDAYIRHNDINNHINAIVQKFNSNELSLRDTGSAIRKLILSGSFPAELKIDIESNYKKLCDMYDNSDLDLDVAIRSSATAEDLPDASFAGQQDTYLNIQGIEQVLVSIKKCFSSLFTDRAISYRVSNKIGNTDIKISVGVQKMARSDLGSSGVAFSIDTETGFNKVIVINGSYGLGELIVAGKIKPDEFVLYKPNVNDKTKECIIDKKLGHKTEKMICDTIERTKIVHVSETQQSKYCLDDENIRLLGRWVLSIEDYYSKKHDHYCPVDVEWAFDGSINKLFIVQARPETVHSKKDNDIVQEYILDSNQTKEVVLSGIAVGNRIGTGKVRIINSIDEAHLFQPGEILVTSETDPTFEPIMKISNGIITNKGSKTCHAAIISREMGKPALVGTLNGTSVLKDGDEITIHCSADEGNAYKGILKYTVNNINFNQLPKIKTKLMLNVGSPDIAFKYANYPHNGVGLAREEFIINNFIKVHPNALINVDTLTDENIQKQIKEIIRAYPDGKSYFIEKLAFGIARIAVAYYPHPVIVRFSDFKSNEYFNLIGGCLYELADEENPMIGFRGASRYYSKEYKEAFGLECMAIRRVREDMGLNNVVVMIPFVRTVEECDKVIDVMKEHGLKKDKDGLEIFMMCEIPSNCLLVDEFCINAKTMQNRLSGYSIGSNDLTQTTLGLDRDSAEVAHIYNEMNPAVCKLIVMAIEGCKRNGVKIGICGDAPSSSPEFAKFLVENNIDSISITPDALIKTVNAIKEIEDKMLHHE